MPTTPLPPLHYNVFFSFSILWLYIYLGIILLLVFGKRYASVCLFGLGSLLFMIFFFSWCHIIMNRFWGFLAYSEKFAGFLDIVFVTGHFWGRGLGWVFSGFAIPALACACVFLFVRVHDVYFKRKGVYFCYFFCQYFHHFPLFMISWRVAGSD